MRWNICGSTCVDFGRFLVLHLLPKGFPFLYATKDEDFYLSCVAVRPWQEKILTMK
ncbi:unnamed protein product [Nezara viridula]|uniref:Uncharacterized protein n=1 Tax=Nezara viridula TaxID=85310 RepID=A0A9P0HBL3_NEZVI|nr:unnamed protein product [Nezara viridula]